MTNEATALAPRPPNGSRIKFGAIAWMIGVSFLLLLATSSGRHLLFQSGAFDLGYFDQAIYLISRGRSPIVSFWGFHFLGGHADWMVYPLALLYWIYPSVYWIFAVQAFALAIATLPTYHLARQAGLQHSLAATLAGGYLLYPLVFNLNLFDFHPEVMALPVILTAVLMARHNRIGWFTACILFCLGCRAALSLTLAAMGIWLLLVEKKRICGAISLLASTTWFLIATQKVIPAFRPAGVEAALRYAYLGDSVPDIITNLFLRPDLILGRVFSVETLGYLVLLIAPLLWVLVWGLSLHHLMPLVVAVPQLAMNILSNAPSQRDLVHQYSLPILPFLLLVAIATLAGGGSQELGVRSQESGVRSHGGGSSLSHSLLPYFRQPRVIVLWSLVGFLALAKYGYFGSRYLSSLDTWGATREAIALVQTKGNVLTNHNIVPHLTHRDQIQFPLADTPIPDLSRFEYILLDTRHPGWRNTPEYAAAIVKQAQTDPQFQQRYQRDDVYLFVRSEI